MEWQEVVRFWFDELSEKDWWGDGAKLDGLITERFARVHAQAAAGELWTWRRRPRAGCRDHRARSVFAAYPSRHAGGLCPGRRGFGTGAGGGAAGRGPKTRQRQTLIPLYALHAQRIPQGSPLGHRPVYGTGYVIGFRDSATATSLNDLDAIRTAMRYWDVSRRRKKSNSSSSPFVRFRRTTSSRLGLHDFQQCAAPSPNCLSPGNNELRDHPP